MRVFVTGGTGLIGTAVIPELLEHGHTVLALARSDAGAEALRASGVEVVRGGLGDLDVLRSATARSDGVINLAFSHDFSSVDAMSRAVAEESAAATAMGDELIGSDRPFVLVAGTPPIPGKVSTEDDVPVMEGPLGGRADTVRAALELAGRGVRSSCVRLPRTVHHDGTGGFAGLLMDFARRSGVSGYPGDGTQRWPAVHALDAAVLFRLALESAPAGTAWHAVADEGDEVRAIAAVIGRRLDLPVHSVPTETFGPLGAIFALDQPSSSTRTREVLDWNPTHPSLLDDLENIQP
jgi:nucleoside-diphosphate-sugar epimerase